MVGASCDDGTYLESTYFVDEDTGYLGTAKMLVACAVLLSKGANKTSGVVTCPPSALGVRCSSASRRRRPRPLVAEGTAPAQRHAASSGPAPLLARETPVV